MIDERGRLGWIVFGVLSLVGLTFAFFSYAILALGECLPRDDSAAMHACDAAKRMELWLYPLLVLSQIALATWGHARGWRWSYLLALFAWLSAGLILWLF